MDEQQDKKYSLPLVGETGPELVYLPPSYALLRPPTAEDIAKAKEAIEAMKNKPFTLSPPLINESIETPEDE